MTSYESFRKDGAEYITSLIAEAVENGSRTAVVGGNMLIDRAIRLPSNFTLVLEDCHLRLSDGCYSNMFVNEHHGTDAGRTLAGQDKSISIVGRGKAILDGGEYNGLSERNHSRNGLPPIWKNNLILFTNVDGFKLSGISCVNQRWWATCFIYCSNGYIGDMYFEASDIGVGGDGVRYRGLKQDKYEEALVKNADGIDLRVGCHDIVIENIDGFTEDDTIALTGIFGDLEREFVTEGLPSDICRVNIRNVRSSAFCTNVRLLNQGGVKLHDITVDGVYDTSENSPHMDRGKHAVRVGDPRLYGERHATADETYNIAIRNVRSRSLYAISLAGEIKNISIYGVECFDGGKMIADFRDNR